MRILLPPSEGKRPPASGPPVDLAALSFPELTAAREQLLDAVVALGSGPAAAGLEALGLSAGQAGELERNAGLRSAPAAPALEVYSGVLYERLDYATLPAAARRRAAEAVLISSALWGVLRPGDRIPAYRLSMGAALPGLGGLAAWWRPALRETLADEGLIVDMRSGAYAAAWKPREAEVVAVRAFTERAGGVRKPVSHMAKASRGDVARALLLADVPPSDAEGVAAVAADHGLRVELSPGAGRARSVDVIVPVT